MKEDTVLNDIFKKDYFLPMQIIFIRYYPAHHGYEKKTL